MAKRSRLLSVIDRGASRRDERGYVLILTALILIPLLLISAMAVDYGAWYTSGSRMQRAADAAALAGVVWLPDLTTAFTPHADLTHRIDVRPHLDAKVAALRAHASQGSGGGSVRTVALLVRLPRPIRRLVLGTEWFREVGRTPDGRLLDDLFGTLTTKRERTL